MKLWLFWAGLSFIVGGGISLALTLGASGPLMLAEDLTGYALGWMGVGVIFIMYSILKNKREKKL